MATKSESSLRRELCKVNDLLRAQRDDNSMERHMLYGGGGVTVTTGDSPNRQSPEFSCEDLERLIAAATGAGDLEAVEHALRYTAVFYPDRAELIIEAIKLGIALNRETAG